MAEAAKVIENTQRDLNIALMNELAIIFDRLGIDTMEVLRAAGTKWNFLPFRPGLVGGHCIGVDPYYLTHKAEMVGYHPEVILAGRRINDGMGKFVAEQTVKHLVRNGWQVKARAGDRARPHVQGGLRRPAQLARDRRHPRAAVVRRRGDRPRSGRGAARSAHEYGVELVPWERLPKAAAIVAAVGARAVQGASARRLSRPADAQGVVADVKSQFDAAAMQASGVTVWRL